MSSNISDESHALLIDTHVLIWYLDGDAKLSKISQEIIDEARERDELYVSAISIWEIALLLEKERIVLSVTLAELRETILSIEGLNINELSLDILVESCQLPHYPYGDPADRMILATARNKSMILMTCDNRMIEYAEKGYLTLANPPKSL